MKSITNKDRDCIVCVRDLEGVGMSYIGLDFNRRICSMLRDGE